MRSYSHDGAPNVQQCDGQSAVSCEISSLHQPNGRRIDRHIQQQYRPGSRSTKGLRSGLEAESGSGLAGRKTPLPLPSHTHARHAYGRTSELLTHGRLHPR